MESGLRDLSERARRLERGLVVAGVAVLLVLAIKAGRHHVFLDNFGTVVEDRLYRSGQLTPGQLEDVIRKYGLRTVINTRENEAPPGLMEAEREACVQNGVDMVRIPMPGDGRGDYDQYELALSILRDTNRLPALVHCARGTHRTGALIASYRVLEQDWEIAEALREMKQYRFDPRNHPLSPHLRAFLEDRGGG